MIFDQVRLSVLSIMQDYRLFVISNMEFVPTFVLSMARSADIEKLYRLYYRPMCLYVTHFLGKRASVEDIVQEGFLSLLGKLDSGRITNPLAYLTTAVRNACLDILRHEGKHEKRTLSDNLPDDDEILESAFDEARLWDAIDTLPEGRRRMFLMHNRDGLKYSEIAKTLGVSEGTVKNQISRALRTLRKSIKRFFF